MRVPQWLTVMTLVHLLFLVSGLSNLKLISTNIAQTSLQITGNSPNICIIFFCICTVAIFKVKLLKEPSALSFQLNWIMCHVLISVCRVYTALQVTKCTALRCSLFVTVWNRSIYTLSVLVFFCIILANNEKFMLFKLCVCVLHLIQAKFWRLGQSICR